MKINDLGPEAIREILKEALAGMRRRTGKAWGLDLDGEQDRLRLILEGRTLTMQSVAVTLPEAPEGKVAAPEAIRFRSALRRNILDVTEALTPAPQDADVPGAILTTCGAIQRLDAIERESGRTVRGLRQDLHRILNRLTGKDYLSGSSEPLNVDWGHKAAPKPTVVPIEADIEAVREAIAEAEACCMDDCDIDGRAHVRALRETLDGLLAEQRRGA